jgi:LmbE family N-acetylglucosaminyl deacetylase
MTGERTILCILAHPDDLELMAGGSVARWVKEGHRVHALSFSTGVWTAPDGSLMRKPEEALAEERKAAAYLGYSVENLGYEAMDLAFEDAHVVAILKRIADLRPDILLFPWEGDSHHDHEVVSRIAFSASRRVPTLLMGQINYYLRYLFTPNVFVDISDTWEEKIRSLECYGSQWDRAGTDWYEYLDATTRYYGKMIGVKRAEGFVSRKLLLG